MKASFLLLTILGLIAVKLVTGKIDRVTVANVVSDKQQPAIAGKIAGRRNGGFQCENGNIISDEWRCDNSDDCGDNSDEFYDCDIECKDDNSWVDKYGNKCSDILPHWCLGDIWSDDPLLLRAKEARRGCPKRCGVCDRDCAATFPSGAVYPIGDMTRLQFEKKKCTCSSYQCFKIECSSEGFGGIDERLPRKGEASHLKSLTSGRIFSSTVWLDDDDTFHYPETDSKFTTEEGIGGWCYYPGGTF